MGLFAGFYIALGYYPRFFPFPRSNAALFWALEVAVVLVPTGLLAALWFADRLAPKDYFLFAPRDLRKFALQTGVAIGCYYSVVYLLSGLIWRFVWQYEFRQPDTSGQLFEEGTNVLTVSCFAVILFLGAFLEEIVYRAMLFELTYPSVRYLLLSPLLFLGIHAHQGVFGMAQAAVFGFVGCLLFLWTKNVLPLALAHLAVNVITFWYRA